MARPQLQTWPTVSLGEVADMCLGKMLDAQKNRGRLQPYLRNPNVRWFGVDLSDVQLMPFEEHEDARYGLAPGDVVICEGGEAGRAAIWDGRVPNMKFQKAIHRVRCGPRLYSRYLVHRLMADYFSGRLADYYTGATIKHLTGQDLNRYRFPLPPLADQRRIAAILDKADALRAQRRAALAKLDTLTQSIFLDMFGDPATNPKGWPVKRIEDITECLDRLRRPVTESDRKLGNVPYYGANGQQGWIDTALFDEPLVLVAEDGGYFDEPGRGVAYRIDGPAWVNNHAHILRAISMSVETEFLHRALRHFNFLPFISGTTRAKLTQGQLNAVRLFVPPLVLQREFSTRIARVQRITMALASSADQLDDLFTSLQHRAFRGDLVRADAVTLTA
ncbi:MAG: hypothetical protein B6D46_12445 [Polyangiaceae bacterium UTPRO1]|jgi:hypothetical protein|nr:restriction endonuclease subunit S [Myxococcales bacterium]OQY65789.1 MAG: hypothetical protein B6D46_12445 [Polyangiaceae bacterium UTPRO1]